MAIYNEILAGRFNKGLQKFFSMKGRAVTPQLAGEIMTVLPLFWGVSERFLEGWERFGALFNQAGVAGQNSTARLRNPTGSGVIVVVEKLSFASATSQSASLEYGANVDLSPILTSVALDLRTRPVSTAVGSSGNNAPSFNFFALPNIQAGVTFDYILFEEQELTILPGTSVSIRTSAANVTLQGNFIWRERPLEDSEKF